MNGRAHKAACERTRADFLAEVRGDLQQAFNLATERYLLACSNISSGYVRAGPVRAAGYCAVPSPSIDDPDPAPELQAPGE